MRNLKTNCNCTKWVMHTQPSQAYKYEWSMWNDARHKVKRERDRVRVKGSSANNKICFEVRAPNSTFPPSHRRISNPLTCPHRTPTQGSSTEDLGQYNKRVHNSSLNRIQPLTEAMHNQHKHHLTQEGRHLANTNQSPHTWGILTQTPPHTRGSQTQSPPLTRGSQPPLQNQPLHKRDITS